MHLALLFVLVSAAKPQTLHDRAMRAYENLDFKQAAELFKQDLRVGDPQEKDTRQRLVLSLYQAGRRDESVNEYHALMARYPAFRFDENEVLPETIAFFDAHKPAAPPKIIKVAPDQPRRIDTTAATKPPANEKRWYWYYLAPLGIGQFLAHSPVHGTLFAVLQAGLIAADVAMFAVFNQQVDSEGRSATPDASRKLQLAMNVVFFSMIGSIVAGAIDGVFFEP